MKITRMLLVAAILVASGFIFSYQEPVQAQSITAYTCADINNPSYDGVYGLSSSFPTDTWSFKAGDTITLVATYAGSGSVPPGTTIALWMNSGIVIETALPGQIIYSFASDTVLPPGGSPVMNWESRDAAGLVDANWTASCSPAPVGGSPANSAPAPKGPGCDLMELTPNAAVGAFVVDAGVFWGPNPSATTGITMPEGKTVWVLGMDKTGSFYKFTWSCTYLWAPVDTLGPNYDKVWNGASLPTTVIEYSFEAHN